MTHGYEGLGLFYTVLEKIGAQEKPVKTAVLKKQLDVGKKLEKVWLFMEQIGLICTKNGETFNIKLLKFSEKYEKIKEKNRERQAQHREKQDVPENVKRDKNARNGSNSIVYNSNNNTHDAAASSTPDLFEQFWDLYDKRHDRKKCMAKFNRLNLTDQQAIIEHVPSYVKIHSNPNFRKNPLTYLNGENWKEPLVASTKTQAQERKVVY